MYWCCLYAVERDGKLTLVYGYAVSAQEPASKWASSLVSACAAWRLNKFNCFLSAVDLRAFGEQLLTGRLQLSTKTGQVEIDTAGLRRRPSVYAIPRTFISSGSPQSFSDEPALVDSFWSVSKKPLIAKAFPEKGFTLEQMREATRTLFRQLQSETSISFLADEAGRFGNFEIVRYLSGDIRKSDGLCCVTSRSDLSLVVWIESPLDAKIEIYINCRMFNGGRPKGRTCILDELRVWDAGTPMRFSPKEPYTEYEVSMWSSGNVIAYQHQSLMRSIGANTTVAGPTLRRVTKWSQGFPTNMRERAESVRLDATRLITTRSPHDDPWRDAELEAHALVESWFPSGTKGRFFLNARESTLEAVEFLSELMRRTGVTCVTIVDPFFDRVGVESLLTRLGCVKEVKVLTSHVLGSKGTVDGTIDLKAACESCRETLPPKLEVINLESPGGTSQQFHDRYVVIESEGKISAREVWMLSNSLSSLAVRYPLVVVPLDQEVANQVADYVKSLDKGQLVERSSLQARVVWTNHRRPIPQSMTPIPHLNREYPGWELILEVLVPDAVPDAERARIAVANGLLNQHLPEIDWQVPVKAIPQVVGKVKGAMSAKTENRHALLTAISGWAYHGGPSATQYGFDSGEVALIRDAFAKHLTAQSQTSRLTYEFPPLRDAVQLPESLEHVWSLLNQGPLDTRNGMTPELFFFAEAIWTLTPHALVQLLDATRNFALFCWVSLYGRTADDRRAQTFLGSQLGAVQALGALFLRDIAEKESGNSGNSLSVLASKLAKSNLPQLELLFSMIFISARYTRPEISDPTPFAACASLWTSQPLSEIERRRVALLVDRAAPNRAIPMISALADECPLPVDASGFRLWCVDQIRAQLPLKPALSQQSEIRVVADDVTLTKAAEAVWHLHEEATSTWFFDEIIKKIDLWTALEPLLRARDYPRWNKALEDVLLAMAFGLAVANAAPSARNREEFLRIAAPNMAKVLLKLGPEVWHHFADFKGRLANVVVFLGHCAELLSNGDFQIVENIVADERMPSVWKLLLVLQSPKLVRKYAVQALSMAAKPTTPACDRDLSTIDVWTERIVTAAELLEKTHDDLREGLVQVRQEIIRWRDGFLPPAQQPP